MIPNVILHWSYIKQNQDVFIAPTTDDDMRYIYIYI